MPTPNYLYTPLSNPWSIRVFILQRANKFDDPLLGTLREVMLPAKSPIQLLKEKAVQLGCQNLNSLPTPTVDAIFNPLDIGKCTHYDALSYVWGEKGGNIPMLCEGKSIEITKNCEEVLSDYWFGPSILDNNAISTGARWSKWFRDTLPLVVLRNVLGTPEPEREMLPAIVQSPWYTRIWTFQEQLLPAKTVYVKWGEYEMSYIRFQQMRNTWHEENVMYEWKRSDVHRSDKHILQQLSPPKRQLQHLWLQILHTGRFLQCSDSRDRLYGLFGILQETGMSVPRPDYSIPVQIVFEDFIRHVIRTEQSLWVLMCTLGRKRDPQLPSWVPDWTVNDPENNLAIYQGMELVFGPYDAAMSSSVDLELLSTGVSPPGKLALKGRLVYEIVLSTGKFPVLTPDEYGEMDDAILQFVSWFTHAFFLGGLNALEKLRLLFWSANRKATTWNEHEFQTVMSSFFYEVRSSGYSFDETDATTYQAMIQAIVGGDPREEPWKSRLVEILDSKDGRKLVRGVWLHFHGATLFSDEYANLGVSWAQFPEIIVTKDGSERFFVALFAGSNVPAVLSGYVYGEMYKLLGPAFVPGIMYSEVWPKDSFTNLDTIILY